MTESSSIPATGAGSMPTDSAPATGAHAPANADPARTLHDPATYADSLAAFVQASPTSFHAAEVVAQRLSSRGFTRMDENEPWEGLPQRGVVVREGAVLAWMLPTEVTPSTRLRVLGAHTDSPALKLKPGAAINRAGYQLLNAEIYGGPLLNSFLDRELGFAGRLITTDGRTVLVRSGAIARVAQVAPHLDRSVNESLHLDPQGTMLPLWSLLDDASGAPSLGSQASGADAVGSVGAEASDAAARQAAAPASDAAHQTGTSPTANAPASDAAGRGERNAIEQYLCELAGIEPSELISHDLYSFPTEAPARFGRHGEFFASSRLDNLSSVQAGLVALEALAAELDGEGGVAGATGAVSTSTPTSSPNDIVVFIANDHEEVGSLTRTGADGPFLEHVLTRLAAGLGLAEDARATLFARSICVSADAGHAIHPNYPQLHDPSVQPLLGRGPLLKLNARARYASDAPGIAAWERACRTAGVPSQTFVGNNSVPCGTTIGPITAGRLGMTTVDVGQPLLSMHSQREMCGIEDGPWMAQAIRSFWAGA